MTGLAHLAKGGPRSARAVMASRDPAADSVDFFPTPPWGARAGAELVKRLDPGARSAWECAAGAGHLAHGLRDYFAVVHESDAYDYGRGVRLFDFTAEDRRTPFVADWIVTNPPFALIDRFVRLGVKRARRGVALLMRLAILEGQARHQLLHLECPLYAVAPFAERLPMHKGRFEPGGVTATAYAWFIWRRGLPAAGDVARLLPIAPGARARLERPSDRAFAVGASAAEGVVQGLAGQPGAQGHGGHLVARQADRGAMPVQLFDQAGRKGDADGLGLVHGGAMAPAGDGGES